MRCTLPRDIDLFKEDTTIGDNFYNSFKSRSDFSLQSLRYMFVSLFIILGCACDLRGFLLIVRERVHLLAKTSMSFWPSLCPWDGKVTEQAL